MNDRIQLLVDQLHNEMLTKGYISAASQKRISLVVIDVVQQACEDQH